MTALSADINLVVCIEYNLTLFTNDSNNNSRLHYMLFVLLCC